MMHLPSLNDNELPQVFRDYWSSDASTSKQAMAEIQLLRKGHPVRSAEGAQARWGAVKDALRRCAKQGDQAHQVSSGSGAQRRRLLLKADQGRWGQDQEVDGPTKGCARSVQLAGTRGRRRGG